MKKKILHFVAILTLLLTVVPMTVMAADAPPITVTINPITAVSPGAEVTVSGTSSTLSIVNIKVLKPDNSIILVDYATVTEDTESYTYKFKASTDVFGTYTVVVGQDSNVASTSFVVSSPPTGGGYYPPSNEIKVPADAQELIDQGKAKIEEIISTGPNVGNSNQDVKETQKAVEDAIKQASTLNVASLVKVENNIAKLEVTPAQLLNAFTDINKIATDANTALNNIGIAPARVVATLDLGTVEADNAQIPIPQELLQAAKDNGIDSIAFRVNGVVVEVSVQEFTRNTTLNITKLESTEADAATSPSQKRASDVYNFEFTSDSEDINQFDTPVGLNIPVNNTDDTDTDLLTLAKVEDDNSLTFYLGKYDEESRSVRGLRDSFSTYMVIENKVVFNDIDSVQAWAGNAINVSAAKGIINGRGEGAYVPQGNITRAEFATLLVKTFGLENAALTENFTDVADGAWYQSYVAAAVHNGIINGRSATIFDPNSNITRSEMATMAANALTKLLGYNAVTDVDSSLAKFNDADQINASFKASVALMTAEGIINGKGNGAFDPSGKSTRAEAAVIIYQLFNLR